MACDNRRIQTTSAKIVWTSAKKRSSCGWSRKCDVMVNCITPSIITGARWAYGPAANALYDQWKARTSVTVWAGVTVDSEVGAAAVEPEEEAALLLELDGMRAPRPARALASVRGALTCMGREVPPAPCATRRAMSVMTAALANLRLRERGRSHRARCTYQQR